jgi:Icc-related predicted phosphoesterase
MLQTTRTRLAALKRDLGHRYPSIFVIPGNDDGGLLEEALLEGEREGIWRYAHGRISDLDGWSRIEHCDRPSVSPAAQRRGEPQDCARLYTVLGYACVPPTPFLLKDWERYDVSRYLGPVDVSPEDGIHLIPFDPEAVRYGTMENDLERLAVQVPDFRRMVCLFHAPPSDCDLDRAALDGRVVDHVPLDLHVGSLAIRRFIESRQPLVSLHGHIHEAPRLTGAWCVKIGRTLAFTAAHDGPELAVIRFDLADPQRAERALV